MAYRDRTPLFLRYRAEARALHARPVVSTTEREEEDDDDKANARLLSHNAVNQDDISASHAALATDIAAARSLLRKLRDGYAAHLLPRFGEDGASSSAGNEALETRVREAAHALTARLHLAQTRVRALATTGDPVRSNLQRRFAAELAAISSEARSRQKDYLDSLQRQRDALGDAPVLGQGAFALHDDDDDDDPDVRAASAQLAAAADANAADIERRERQLRDVASSVSQLATLVNDLAGLVVDQGTLLDRIDYNLETTHDTTKSAVRELRHADAHQRKRQAFCIIVLLAIACGIMSILLVLRWTS